MYVYLQGQIAITTTCTNNKFEYFDLKEKQWTKVRSMRTLDWVPSLIVVDDKLFAAGGVEKVYEEEYDSDPDYFEVERYRVEYRRECRLYNAEQNKWSHLPPMSIACKPLLVYLNKCIYAICGKTNSGLTRDVECFEIAANKWKNVDSLPYLTFTCTSAVVCQGSILVYGQHLPDHSGPSTKQSRGEILVYNPSSDKSVSRFTEVEEVVPAKPKPVLVVHKNQCYRVAFHAVPPNPNCSNKEVLWRTGCREFLPVVNVLELRSSRSNTISTVSLGEAVKQDFIPPNQLGAFRIEKDVYITTSKGALHVHTIDLKILSHQDGNIDLSGYQKLGFGMFFNIERSNFVTFTCDLK